MAATISEELLGLEPVGMQVLWFAAVVRVQRFWLRLPFCAGDAQAFSGRVFPTAVMFRYVPYSMVPGGVLIEFAS